MTPDELDRIADLALELVERVREVDPERNHTWLLSLTEEQRYGMLFALAAMVDPSVGVRALLAWTYPLVDAAAAVVKERFDPKGKAS